MTLIVQKFKVGIIGFGLSGKTFHAPLLKANNNYEVVMVCSSRAQEVSALLPESKVVKDAFDIIGNRDIDLIVNCAPNNFHYSYSAAALENGKHVVVEKPFVTLARDGELLIELAKRTGKVLSTFHNRRWDSDFLTVKNVMTSGDLGQIKQFESHIDRWRPVFRPERWREQPLEGSGVFYDLGPHLIDQAVSLFGTPERLTSDIECQKEDGLTDDYFHIVFHYDKMRVILHSSSFAPKTARFQIFGTKASFVKFGLDPQEDQLKSGISPDNSSFGVEDQSNFGHLITDGGSSSRIVASEKGAYGKYYELLYKALTGERTEIPVTAEQALTTIKLIELAHKSSQQGTTLECRDH